MLARTRSQVLQRVGLGGSLFEIARGDFSGKPCVCNRGQAWILFGQDPDEQRTVQAMKRLRLSEQNGARACYGPGPGESPSGHAMEALLDVRAIFRSVSCHEMKAITRFSSRTAWHRKPGLRKRAKTPTKYEEHVYPAQRLAHFGAAASDSMSEPRFPLVLVIAHFRSPP